MAGEKKKKKKSRVQVALNTLRAEGVEAFKDYLEARVDETALLDTLVERIKRAQDLAGVRAAALDAVTSRLRTLDPMAVADLPQASAPDPELVVEGAAAAPVKTSRTVQDTAPDGAQARLRALDPRLVAGLPQASAQDPKLVFEGAAVAPVKISRAFQDAAPGVAQARRRAQDPRLVTGLPQASAPDPELVVEGAAAAPVKTSRTVQDTAPDGAQARLRALDPRLVAGLPQASAQGPELVAEGAIAAPVKTSLSVHEGVLFISCVRGDVNQVERLLSFGNIDINMMGTKGTLLHLAVEQNQQAVVKFLLSRPGIKINLGDPSGATPLFAAARLGHLEVARMLLSRSGIDVNLGDSTGVTPLFAAAQLGRLEIAGVLLQHPAINPSIGISEHGERHLPLLHIMGMRKWSSCFSLPVKSISIYAIKAGQQPFLLQFRATGRRLLIC